MATFVFEGWEIRPLCGAVEDGVLTRAEIPPIVLTPDRWIEFKSGGDDVALSGVKDLIEGATTPDTED